MAMALFYFMPTIYAASLTIIILLLFKSLRNEAVFCELSLLHESLKIFFWDLRTFYTSVGSWYGTTSAPVDQMNLWFRCQVSYLSHRRWEKSTEARACSLLLSYSSCDRNVSLFESIHPAMAPLRFSLRLSLRLFGSFGPVHGATGRWMWPLGIWCRLFTLHLWSSSIYCYSRALGRLLSGILQPLYMVAY